jgi:hypothetical protein
VLKELAAANLAAGKCQAALECLQAVPGVDATCSEQEGNALCAFQDAELIVLQVRAASGLADFQGAMEGLRILLECGDCTAAHAAAAMSAIMALAAPDQDHVHAVAAVFESVFKRFSGSVLVLLQPLQDMMCQEVCGSA